MTVNNKMSVDMSIRLIGLGELGIRSVKSIEELNLPGVRTMVCDSDTEIEQVRNFINGDAEIFIVVEDLGARL